MKPLQLGPRRREGRRRPAARPRSLPHSPHRRGSWRNATSPCGAARMPSRAAAAGRRSATARRNSARWRSALKWRMRAFTARRRARVSCAALQRPPVYVDLALGHRDAVAREAARVHAVGHERLPDPDHLVPRFEDPQPQVVVVRAATVPRELAPRRPRTPRERRASAPSRSCGGSLRPGRRALPSRCGPSRSPR